MRAKPSSGDEIWHAILSGELEQLRRFRWLVGRMPREPRCPLCLAPFHGVGGTIMRLLKRGRSRMNPRFCDFCERQALRNPGGTEIEISMFIADVRESTTIAETLDPTRYAALMNRFYNMASEIVISEDGLIDKFVGDAMVALFVPGFAGAAHADAAVSAARRLLAAAENENDGRAALPIGIGINTGQAYVGAMGPERGAADITAMGDAMNVTARLAGAAPAGNAYISAATVERLVSSLHPADTKSVSLRGVSGSVSVHIIGA